MLSGHNRNTVITIIIILLLMTIIRITMKIATLMIIMIHVKKKNSM